LGYNAGSSLTTGSANINIGSVGFATETTTTRIGTSPLQTQCYIAGISGQGYWNGTPKAVYVTADGKLFTEGQNSSRRFKQEIADRVIELSRQMEKVSRQLDERDAHPVPARLER